MLRPLLPLYSVLLAGSLAAQPAPAPSAAANAPGPSIPSSAVGAEPATVLADEVVTASRMPQPAERVAATVATFSGDDLRSAPALTLDRALRAAPAFGLFRRSDSLVANPTAQGVSLRGLGPSGASRSLIVLDGVPLNDPFGGWVAWSKIPRENLRRAEIVPGGGTTWGNAALGGVIQLFTEEVQDKHLRAVASFGDFGTVAAEFSATLPMGTETVQVLARDFKTDGFSLVAPERAGAIDVAAWSRHRWASARWRHEFANAVEMIATVRVFEETRGNGTPYQRNGSREKFASVSAAGPGTGNFVWSAVAYAQDQSFASTFSSVNATRTAETPASDQFAVPAKAVGFAWTGAWQHDDGSRTSGGFDARHVSGETREHFTFAAGDFTRLRVAGGAQSVAGIFALHERPLAPDLRLTLGARIDSWNETDGHRRESDRATGVASRDDRYADRSDGEFSPSAGLVWSPARAWRVRASAQQAFRRATLNELYRPFRQGANVTEANAALSTERVTSGEVGVEWTSHPRAAGAGVAAAPYPYPGLTLGATGFWNDFRDAVGNVTIARGPGTFPIVGTLGAGGIGRQRLNLDRLRVQGVEFNARWQWTRALSADAALILNDATVREAAIAPGLVGKRVAQVPRRAASIGATWRAPGGFTLAPRVRWMGRQFEDDENTLILGEVVTVDLSLSHPLGRHAEIFLNAENLGDARIETGRSADGIVNVGTPRFVFGGIRCQW